MDCENSYSSHYLIDLELDRTGDWADDHDIFVAGLFAGLHSAGYHEVEDHLIALAKHGDEAEFAFGCHELLHFHYTGEMLERGIL